jgi:hypothetical protein
VTDDVRSHRALGRFGHAPELRAGFLELRAGFLELRAALRDPAPELERVPEPSESAAAAARRIPAAAAS